MPVPLGREDASTRLLMLRWSVPRRQRVLWLVLSEVSARVIVDVA